MNKPNARSKEVRDEVERIFAVHGKMTPQILLSEARAVDSPLHCMFQWDDSVAGEKWRLRQAQVIIQAQAAEVVIRIHHAIGPTDVRVDRIERAMLAQNRMWVNSRNGKGYLPREDVKVTTTERQDFVLQKCVELAGWLGSVRDFEEFDPIREIIHKFLKRRM